MVNKKINLSELCFSITDNVKHQLNIIKKGCSELLVEIDFINKLSNSITTAVPLRIKFGLDPTSSDIHIGHTIVFNKIKQLQDLGHKIIIIIGDFTALIGDPSGRNVTRPLLSCDQIKINAKHYFEQISLLLDIKNTEIYFNSEWLAKLNADHLIKLTSCTTVARMLERNDFAMRFSKHKPILIYEFLYPLIQAYDSVSVNADLEIGGTDQKFNLLMGRVLQKHYNQQQQSILTMPLLEGLDGIEKMSKSKNNYISITDHPNDMFGKIMSISDSLMWRYYKLLSVKSATVITQYQRKTELGANPKNYKVELALELVTRFHSSKIAEYALENFNLRAKRQVPEDICTTIIKGSPIGIIQILKATKLIKSNLEAHRNLEQGGVKINGTKISDKNLKLKMGNYLLQIGKHKFIRIKIL